MSAARRKIESFRALRDKSGHRFYEFSTSWWSLLFFLSLVSGCVIWNAFIPSHALRFDPYPYNGLRTALALLGAIQTPLLLLHSKKSTDYRKKLLEQDFELEQKIFSKIECLEEMMKNYKERSSLGETQQNQIVYLKKKQRKLLKEAKQIQPNSAPSSSPKEETLL